VLEANGLRCERGGRTLFRDLALSAAAGELLRIAGANGSGKTSLLKILCGLLAPAHGEVRWHGRPVHGLREEYSRHIVYLGHAPAVKDDLTAAENLDIACRLGGIAATPQALQAALDRFGVPHGNPVRRLSQGQRRRSALARLVLSAQAPLWLLDEPFTALDAAAAQLMRTVLREHVAAGGAAIYTTHQDAGLAETRVIEL
jgi:heme exporter protein A